MIIRHVAKSVSETETCPLRVVQVKKESSVKYSLRKTLVVVGLQFCQWLTGEGKCQFMEALTLTTKEQTRLRVLNRVLAWIWSLLEAAQVQGMSERQGWRLLASYRKQGAAALVHKIRGRVPPNTTPTETRQRVVSLDQESFGGINNAHLTELLPERQGVALPRLSVRRLLVGAVTTPAQVLPPLRDYP